MYKKIFYIFICLININIYIWIYFEKLVDIFNILSNLKRKDI